MGEVAGVDECWTIDQVAMHLGVTVDAARGNLSRMGVRGVYHYPAAEVRRLNALRPGRGRPRSTCINDGCENPAPADEFCDPCHDSIVLLPED